MSGSPRSNHDRGLCEDHILPISTALQCGESVARFFFLVFAGFSPTRGADGRELFPQKKQRKQFCESDVRLLITRLSRRPATPRFATPDVCRDHHRTRVVMEATMRTSGSRVHPALYNSTACALRRGSDPCDTGGWHYGMVHGTNDPHSQPHRTPGDSPWPASAQ
jgi:hypothetical protein